MEADDIEKIINGIDKSNLIGRGSFGYVYKVDGYVVKRFIFYDTNDNNNGNNNNQNSISTSEFEDEVKTWEELSKISELKPYIPEFIGSIIIKRRGYIIQKYESVLSMEKFLEGHEKIDEDFGINLFNNLLKGFNVLHRNKFIHRDIKPANILIRTHENKEIPMIIDFGLVCKMPCNKLAGMGTPSYTASNFLNYSNRKNGILRERTFPVTKKNNSKSGWLGCLSCRHTRKMPDRRIKVKEPERTIRSYNSYRTDKFALALVLEELFNIIKWKENSTRKEKAEKIIESNKYKMVSALAALSARRNKPSA
jgi:serine/threonine protein kinase